MQANEVRVIERRRGVPVVVFVICLVLALVLGAVAGFVGSAVAGAGPVKSTGKKVDQNKLDSLHAQIEKYYKGDIVEEDLVEGAYHGYVSGLNDPYSAYMTKEEVQSDEESYESDYSGVGITFEQNEQGGYEVVSVSKGSPAEKAGIVPGDFLLSVDGKTYSSSDVMAAHIRGDKGTKVTVEVMHDGKSEDVTMVRDTIHHETVEYRMLDDQTGYIQISGFIEGTADDFDKALAAIEGKGAKNLVLDLRNNGGGLVDECAKVADDFLDAGVITYVQDKNGKEETYDARDGKTGLKTVVLVNGYSASASEILTGALQDNDFPVVGEKTFGKGVIQVTFPQKDGSGLKLTIMEYLTPDRHPVHKKGVTPNTEIEDDEDTDADEQLDKAKELVEK
ncbi:MAG: S41 family peptidase [Firmicutes bacterium]|nr:S41 family peptidase [Bacillota bacterium]